MDQSIMAKWEELKVLVESIESDILKNANGNASAGVRARRGLRSLKSEAATLVKLSLDGSKK